MSSKSKAFKESYKVNPIRTDAISKFNADSKGVLSKQTREYMYQVMATLGLEIETRFPYIFFEDDKFRLFGREKSQKSISTKKKMSIQSYNEDFKEALKNGEENLPNKIRPILDFYGFKLVCDNVKDLDTVLSTVIYDILSDIKEISPQNYHEIRALINNNSVGTKNPLEIAVHIAGAIEKDFPTKYDGLENKFETIKQQQQQAEDINQFLSDNASLDVSTMTYKDYYEKIADCYSILRALSYENCYEENQKIENKLKKAQQHLKQLGDDKSFDAPLDIDLQEEKQEKLDKLLKEIASKRTNKLDLSVGDLIIFDILQTSRQLRNLGVTYSKDPTRTKEKRTANGYVANFYSLDMPNNLTAELQIQSIYRYNYGEHGPAAHNRMENNIKKRTLYKKPKHNKGYNRWENRQFRALPKYFTYKGGGNIHIYNTLDNFRRYYDCEQQDKVTEYVQYIASHNIKLLYTDFKRFTLTSPSVLEQEDSDKNDDYER